jgi:hypothetical protein
LAKQKKTKQNKAKQSKAKGYHKTKQTQTKQTNPLRIASIGDGCTPMSKLENSNSENLFILAPLSGLANAIHPFCLMVGHLHPEGVAAHKI